RDALHGASPAARGKRRCHRGGVGGTGQPRRDDRRATALSDPVWPQARQMGGVASLPRDNGELVFEAPWQGRVLAMAVGLVQRLGLSWDEVRARLTDAIADHPERPYYASWTAALEALVTALHAAPTTAAPASTRRIAFIRPFILREALAR